MKTTNLLLTLIIILSAFLFSCSKKQTNNTATTRPTYSSMDSIFSMLSVQPKTLSVDAVNGGSYYGNSGTRYIFYGNSFMTAAGGSVTGTVQIQVSEYLQKGDMLFSKMLPISNNEPLLSGGEINVSATQNGQPVYLQPYNYFQANLPQPGTPDTAMKFFSGQPTLDTTQFKTNWIGAVADSNHYFSGFVEEIAAGGDTLSIISDSLKECNADYFMTSPNFQTFTVTITVTGATLPSTGKPYGYTLYDNYKGEWPLGEIGSYSNGIFTEEHVPNIPVHFAVFTLINGNFYGGTLGATPTTGSNYTVMLNLVDATVFKAQLNAL